MAEGFRAAASNENTANSATVTGTVPAGVLANDGLIVTYAVAGTGSTVPTPPAGYTQINASPIDKGTVLRVYVYAKVATGADAGASVTVTKSTADSTKKYITIAAYSGIDTANFITTLQSTLASFAETTAGLTHNAPAVTVTGSSNWIGEFMVDRGSPASTDITPPTGFTERAQQVGTGTGTCTTEWCDSGGTVAAGTHSGDVFTSTGNSTANAITLAMVIKAAGGTPATATPPVLNATVTFHAPTVLTGGPVTVNPDVLRMTTAFFPVVGAGNALITPDLLTATVTFHAPTVGAQANALTVPDPIAMTVTFFAPAITDTEVVNPPPDNPPTTPKKFRSPTRIESWPLREGSRLAYKVEVNLTMFRINGVWHAGENLTYVDLEHADRVYYGGYEVAVPQDELAEMVAQGFDVAVDDIPDTSGSEDIFLDLFTDDFPGSSGADIFLDLFTESF